MIVPDLTQYSAQGAKCAIVDKSPINRAQCMFLDIETVPFYPSFGVFLKENEKLAKCWIETKAKTWFSFRKDDLEKIETLLEDNVNLNFLYPNENWEYIFTLPTDTQNAALLYNMKGGLFKEYCKIACISFSYIKNEQIVTNSFIGDEFELLRNFSIAFDKAIQTIKSNRLIPYVVGHNILLFDIPTIYTRCIINGIWPNNLLHESFQKPWDKRVLDTRDLWRANSKDSDSSLNTISTLLGLESSKTDEIDGGKVSHVFYVEKDIKKIVDYCERDVLKLIELFDRLQNLIEYKFKN